MRSNVVKRKCTKNNKNRLRLAIKQVYFSTIVIKNEDLKMLKMEYKVITNLIYEEDDLI